MKRHIYESIHIQMIAYFTIAAFSFGFCVAAVNSDNFFNASSWSTNDPGEFQVGEEPDGYEGVVFDGRYVYFVPRLNSQGAHGEVLRYDTTGAFKDNEYSWSAYDPGDHGLGNDPDGYSGGVFDGQYIYFVPSHNGTEDHGEILRFDTTEIFDDLSSWSAYDPGDDDVGTDPDGYYGGVFDGRYVYFAPYMDDGVSHSEVLRYDTDGSFDISSSWLTHDPGTLGGYEGAVFDGRYIYFVPHWDEVVGSHGEVLRYDTTNGFNDLDSWTAYDPGDDGLGTDPDGYVDAIFDGRYIYFGPNYNGPGFHGEVLRYDTRGDFETLSSWSAYDPNDDHVGNNPIGYQGVVFDGRYVYFVPNQRSTSERHCEVLRYDTSGDFDEAFYWTTYDPGDHGVGTDPDGYKGAVFDGRYIYFGPYHNGSHHHGEVLRYDTFPYYADTWLEEASDFNDELQIRGKREKQIR